MTEVQLLVTLQVDPDGVDPNAPTYTDEQLRDAALEGVSHALKYAHQEGFVHELAETVSIGVAAVEFFDPIQCTHCPDEGCPGVLGPDGSCSHCGHDYEEQ